MRRVDIVAPHGVVGVVALSMASSTANMNHLLSLLQTTNPVQQQMELQCLASTISQARRIASSNQSARRLQLVHVP